MNLFKSIRERLVPTLERELERHSQELLSRKNVVGIARGNKIVKGIDTKIECITILVVKKKKENRLDKKDIVPKKIGSYSTDVIEVGKIEALAAKVTGFLEPKSIDRKSRIRPLVGGISIGNYRITAGTLGCFISHENKPVILSNWHVLKGVDGELGDTILQPGKYDGGKVDTDKIGELKKFIPILFEGDETCTLSKGVVLFLNAVTKLLGRKARFSYRTSPPINYCDAAISSIEIDYEPSLIDIGYLTGYEDVDNEEVTTISKSGRTTGTTEAKILYKDATVRVDYGGGKTALFKDQIVTEYQSAGGDSGSAGVWDNKLIGLLFAGSSSVTIFSKIKYVKDGLELGNVL